MKLWCVNFSWLLVLIWLWTVRVQGAEQAPDAAGDTRRSINLEALSRLKGLDLDANPSVKAVVLKLLDQVRGAPQFVELVRDFKIQGQDPGLLEIAADEPASTAGVEAMRLVLSHSNADLLQAALAGTNAIRVAEALGNTSDKAIVPLLEPVVVEAGRDLALRKQAVRAIVKVQEGAAALLDLAGRQKLPDDLKLTAGSELSNVRWPDLRLKAVQLLPPPRSQDAHALPPISELAKLRGDARNGAAVFRREAVGCPKCHQVNGQGVDFGPNLSEIGTKLAREAIYEAILDPSAGIAFGYEAWQLTLKDGDEAYGLIVSETADEITLKAVGGVVTHYRKSDIAERTKQKLSIMPTGLEQAMTTQELVDLVEYLTSLRKAVK
jgi:putative heme-binding domain-containing protein